MARGLVLEGDGLRLRSLRMRDEDDWLVLRAANRDWLKPWEATPPPEAREEVMGFRRFVRLERRQLARLESIPLAIEVDGALVGRIAVAGIQWGAQRGGSLGYWIDERHAGRGLVTRAAAMLATHAFDLGMHRIEIAVRPENAASIRVAEKLGFTPEGLRRSYLFIDGAWRDHLVFARTQDQARHGRYWEVGD